MCYCCPLFFLFSSFLNSGLQFYTKTIWNVVSWAVSGVFTHSGDTGTLPRFKYLILIYDPPMPWQLILFLIMYCAQLVNYTLLWICMFRKMLTYSEHWKEQEQSELRWLKVPDWLLRFSSAWGDVIPISKVQGALQEEACITGNYSNGAAMRFPMDMPVLHSN